MGELVLFHFENHEIRCVGDGVNHKWVAQDVCNVLGIKNVSDALEKLDDDEKGLDLIQTLGGSQSMLTVNEYGLYTLILRCRKSMTPGSVPYRFRRWVTHDVIPAIRKTGSYSVEQHREQLERQFLPAPTLKEIREAASLYASVYGKAYKSRYVDQKIQEFYPALKGGKPDPEEKPSLPAQALLTPTQIGERLKLFTKSGRGDARRVNKLIEQMGYQIKVSGMWSSTDKAISAGLCDRKPVNTDSRTQKDQLLWSESVISLLQELV